MRPPLQRLLRKHPQLGDLCYDDEAGDDMKQSALAVKAAISVGGGLFPASN